LAALLCVSCVACTTPEEDGNELDNYTPPATTFKISTGTLTFKDGPAESAIITEYQPSPEYATKQHEVVIPAVINEREVSAIGAEAFYFQNLITSVKLPATVEYIDDFAFAGCTSLASIEIPESTQRIGEFAFQGCISLASVTFAGNALESIEGFAFDYCTALKDIVLPEGLISIGNQSFGYCVSITAMVMPGTLKTIGNLALYGCAGLNADGALTLSKSIEEIGEFAFEGINKNYIVAPEGSYAAEYVDYMFDSEE
jgi:hypothetical protein